MKHLFLAASVFVIGATASGAAIASNWKVAFGGEYLSQSTKRGTVLYDSFQVIPIWALDLGSPDLQLVGTSLYYKRTWADGRVRWRTRLVPNATPDRPLYETNGNRQGADRKRTRTGEWDNFFEFHIKDLAETRLELSQDISAHKGTYFELSQRLILGGWWERNGAPMLQPALFMSLGGGSAAHNEYLYGRGAGSGGFTNWGGGLLVGSPGAIDTFWPTIQITRWQNFGPAKRGAFVGGKNSGVQIIALAAFRIF